MSEVSATQNTDGSVSSKRVMYIWFSIGLAVAGVLTIGTAIIAQAAQWWPYASGGGLAALGVLHALITGGYIKAQDLAEIASKAKGE
jgi:predicted anti-sigma-YlaC factor YlaD